MIRQVTAQDYQAIRDIKRELGIDRSRLQHADYRLSLQKNGFLLFPDLEWTEYERDISKLFLGYEVDGTVVGYIRIDTEQEIRSAQSASWFREDLQPVYFARPHADIGAIAVSPKAGHRGVGATLLSRAEEELRRQGVLYLFSLVVASPITNVPSLLFHEKHGFGRVAFTSHHELFGLKNYQSILYGKKL